MKRNKKPLDRERLLELSGPSGEEQLDSLFRRMEDEEE